MNSVLDTFTPEIVENSHTDQHLVQLSGSNYTKQKSLLLEYPSPSNFVGYVISKRKAGTRFR